MCLSVLRDARRLFFSGRATTSKRALVMLVRAKYFVLYKTVNESNLARVLMGYKFTIKGIRHYCEIIKIHAKTIDFNTIVL